MMRSMCRKKKDHSDAPQRYEPEQDRTFGISLLQKGTETKHHWNRVANVDVSLPDPDKHH